LYKKLPFKDEVSTGPVRLSSKKKFTFTSSASEIFFSDVNVSVFKSRSICEIKLIDKPLSALSSFKVIFLSLRNFFSSLPSVSLISRPLSFMIYPYSQTHFSLRYSLRCRSLRPYPGRYLIVYNRQTALFQAQDRNH